MIENKKHSAFIDNYMANGYNATQAYFDVYKSSSRQVAQVSSQRLLNMQPIKDEINRRQKEVAEATNTDRDGLIAVLNEMVKQNRYGKPFVALKAIELLNKMCGFNEADKSVIEFTEQPLFNFDPEQKDE
jgi:phage terminase small subunit